MFFQRHFAPSGQLRPPWTCTAIEPAGPSCCSTFSLSYFAAVEIAPSKTQTCCPLIQVVILGYFPSHRTRAVFHSFNFQALSHSAAEHELARPASAAVMILSAEKSTSCLPRYVPLMSNVRGVKPPSPSP